MWVRSKQRDLQAEHRPPAIRARISSGEHVSPLADAVLGAVDGVVTTFAVVAGSTGGELPLPVIMILGMANDIWTTNDVGMLKGLIQTGNGLGAWKGHLCRNPFGITQAFIASGTTARLLPETILGRPSVAPGQVF